jgi:hypothetical protein
MSENDVTDHAVICYLERVYGVDVAGLKLRIAKITAEGRQAGAQAVNHDGVRFVLGRNGRVVTVQGVNGKLSKRALRLGRRHK